MSIRSLGDGRFIKKYSDGSVYEGEMKGNERSGKGKYTSPPPSGCSTYEGERRNDCDVPYVYEGNFSNDSMDGEGVSMWANGSVYEGEMKGNKRSGKGKYTSPSGQVYDGEWRNGNQNGKGMVTWPDGRKFEGVFVNGDIKHGEPSKMTRGDGTREGNFDESWKVWLEAAPLPTYADANRAYWREQFAQHKGDFYDLLGGSKSKTKRRESKNKKCKNKYKYQKNKKECSFKNNTNKKRRQSHRK